MAAYAIDRDRGRLKAAATRRFLAGATRAELEADAQRFAAELGQSLLRPDAVRSWRRWQGRGARLAIVTASPETIVAPIARALGADLLIGSCARCAATRSASKPPMAIRMGTGRCWVSPRNRA
jgi:phosphatidylglycerophosphatase C